MELANLRDFPTRPPLHSPLKSAGIQAPDLFQKMCRNIRLKRWRSRGRLASTGSRTVPGLRRPVGRDGPDLAIGSWVCPRKLCLSMAPPRGPVARGLQTKPFINR